MMARDFDNADFYGIFWGVALAFWALLLLSVPPFETRHVFVLASAPIWLAAVLEFSVDRRIVTFPCCGVCGYSSCGLSTTVCPECGSSGGARRKKLLRRPRLRVRGRRLAWGLIGAAVAVPLAELGTRWMIELDAWSVPRLGYSWETAMRVARRDLGGRFTVRPAACVLLVLSPYAGDSRRWWTRALVAMSILLGAACMLWLQFHYARVMMRH